MYLSETTFEQFVNWCEENKKNWHTEREYITIPKLQIIYDYCVVHKLQCKGTHMSVSWKNNEWLCSLREPIKETIDDTLWSLFHEVWCKAEWAIRCTKTDTELGYESVKSDFGLNIIKQLREAA